MGLEKEGQKVAEKVQEEIMRGGVVMRVENENQASFALLHPRTEKACLDKAIAELREFPEFAAKAFYSIPYGEKKGSDVKVMVEGPSIKAAMALARTWGNCAAAGRISEEQPDRWIVQGAFVDYETNTRVMRDITVSKFITYKNGFTEKIRPDRVDKAIQAGISKAQRNAILSALPAHIVNRYFLEAKKVVAGLRSGKDGLTKMTELVKEFQTLEVSVEMIEKYLEKPLIETTPEDFAELTGILNAIQDNQEKVQEIFGQTEEKPAETSKPTGQDGPFQAKVETPPPAQEEKKQPPPATPPAAPATPPVTPQKPPDALPGMETKTPPAKNGDEELLDKITDQITRAQKIIPRAARFEAFFRGMLTDFDAKEVLQVKDKKRFCDMLTHELDRLEAVLGKPKGDA